MIILSTKYEILNTKQALNSNITISKQVNYSDLKNYNLFRVSRLEFRILSDKGARCG
jgi:hypothetical protein